MSELIGKLSKILYRRFGYGPQDRSLKINRWMTILHSCFVGTVAMCAIIGIIYASHFYSSTKQMILNDPYVWDASSYLDSYISFAKDPNCDHQCWLDKDYDTSSWHRASLPRENLRQLKDFSLGVENHYIAYRLELKVPPDLFNQERVIGFSPVYIGHRLFDVYVNGRHVQRSSGAELQGAVITLGIPPDSIDQEGKVRIGIEARLHPDDEGIFHAGPMLVGDKLAIDHLFIESERTQASYYLLFIVAKGAVLLFFAILFFFSRRRAIFFFFLVFAVMVTIEELLRGSFLYHLLSLPQQALIYFMVKIGSSIALLQFFLKFFGIKMRWWLRQILLIASVGVAGLAVYDFGWGTKTVTVQDLFLGTNIYLLICVCCIIFVAFLARSAQRLGHIPGRKLRNINVTIVLMSIYGILMCGEIFLREYSGFDNRALLDLMLFYWLAWIVANDLRYNEMTIAHQVRELSETRLIAGVGKMAQMMVHDIRKPLVATNIMIKKLRQAKSPESLDAIVAQYSEEIHRNTKLIEALLEDVLEVQGRSLPEVKSLSLKEALERNLNQVFLVADAKAISFKFDLQHASMVRGANISLDRILANLIRNAREATPLNGVISFRSTEITSGKSKAIRLEIHNTGSYISPKEQQELFEAFYTKGKFQGTGLGLAIVKKKIEEMDGSIDVNSHPSEGTSFIIEMIGTEELDSYQPKLPNQASELTLESPPPVANTPTGDANTPRVLVVDDSLFVTQAWESSLGVSVITFNDPALLIQAIENGMVDLSTFDAIILDMYFGRHNPWDGNSLAEKLRSLAPQTPILLSSVSSQLVEDISESHAFNARIPKDPLDWSQLSQIIEGLST